MDNTNIFYKQNGKCFQFRVGAIIIHNNKALFATNNDVDFYFTIGGRVQFGELAIQALEREIDEELGMRLAIDNLACISENFYKYTPDSSYTHEIGFYYFIKDTKLLASVHEIFFEGEQKNILKWIEIDKLREYKIFPEKIVDVILSKQNNIL